MWPPEEQVTEDSHVNHGTEHNDGEASDVLHQGAEDHGADCVDNTETDHNISDLTDSQGARHVSLQLKF